MGGWGLGFPVSLISQVEPGQAASWITGWSSSQPAYSFQFNEASAVFKVNKVSNGAAVSVWTVDANAVNFTFGVPVILAADPTAPLGAATKQMVDGKVAKVGDTMTGNLAISPASGTASLVLNASAAGLGCALWKLRIKIAGLCRSATTTRRVA